MEDPPGPEAPVRPPGDLRHGLGYPGDPRFRAGHGRLEELRAVLEHTEHVGRRPPRRELTRRKRYPALRVSWSRRRGTIRVTKATSLSVRPR